MRLLMIASGYLPYLFSENLCNAKLALAFSAAGIDVDVISKIDEGPSYGDQWTEPWLGLRDSAHLITYPAGNPVVRLADAAYSSVCMGTRQPGIRWVRRAYERAIELMKEHRYDAVLTRSPTDIAHIVGYKLKQKTGIRWIANWNDPASGIWPVPYKHDYTSRQQRKAEAYETKMLLNADVVTFPCDNLRNHFISHFPQLADCKTAIVPHIALTEAVFKKSEEHSNEKLMLCHSGNLSKERDPELTFRAMREIIDEGFSGFEFHIMGFVDKFTEEKIRKYNLEDHVKCIGSFPYFEALERMQKYDVLVLLEAELERGIFFASKFTDYAQCDRPVLAISPTTGFAKDMIATHGGGWVADNTDYKSIKTQLKRVMAQWRDGTIKENKPIYLYREFSAEKVVAIYKGILGEQSD